MPHKTLDELPADEAMRLIGNFAHYVKSADAEARRAQSRLGLELGSLALDSVEYALAICALASEENQSQKDQFAQLVRILRTIRPPTTGGRMGRPPVPEQFGDLWPHERLVHKTWTSFVTTPRKGERDPENEQRYAKPPGLGWSKQYESNIAKGVLSIEEMVKRANPEAPPETVATKVDEVTAGAGADTTYAIGEKVKGPFNLDSPAQAELVLQNLATSATTAEDIRARGAEALTDPKPKGKRRGKVERAFEIIERMNHAELLELDRQIRPLIVAAETP